MLPIPARGRLHKRATISGNPVVTERYAGSDQMMSVHGGPTHTPVTRHAAVSSCQEFQNAADITLIAAAGGWEGDTSSLAGSGREKKAPTFILFFFLIEST